MMGRFCYTLLLLVLLLLSVSFSHSHGHGFDVKVIESGDSSVHHQEENGERREMIEVLDYQLEPGPNTNPKSGFAYGPPPHG